MKNLKLWFIIIFIFVGTPLFAQESGDPFFQNIGGLTSEDCIRLLQEGSHEDKLLAIGMLAEIGETNEKVIEELTSCLYEGTLYVKRQAGKVVNDFWDVRAKSAEALGKIGDSRALYGLHTALRYDHDPVVRSTVATALGKIGHPESIPHLARTIKTSDAAGPDEIVIKSCVEAIGEIGDKEGFWILVEVMRGKYGSDIRLSARDALRKLK